MSAAEECNFHEYSNVKIPILPQKRKALKRYKIKTAEGSHSATVEDYYHQAHFEVLDLATAGILDRFNEPGCNIYI